jgi:FKBP-type peptidyl-prolyl cis-trans isomerase FkpA
MKKLIAASAITLFILSCSKFKNNDSNNGGSQQCTYDSCAVKAPDAEIQALKTYLDTNHITATKHCSGLYYNIETAGIGTSPTACSFVTVKYVGKLTNGTVFDQTQGTNTYSNYLSYLIRGWVNGIPYLRPGGKIHLYIPPTLGYGNQAQQNIPANSILVFDVELVNVQ